jgi:hypothetical protein
MVVWAVLGEPVSTAISRFLGKIGGKSGVFGPPGLKLEPKPVYSPSTYRRIPRNNNREFCEPNRVSQSNKRQRAVRQ